ncbi:MAG: hypothetical protein AABX73_01715 [Nanoarchaeota archaeon]
MDSYLVLQFWKGRQKLGREPGDIHEDYYVLDEIRGKNREIGIRLSAPVLEKVATMRARWDRCNSREIEYITTLHEPDIEPWRDVGKNWLKQFVEHGKEYREIRTHEHHPVTMDTLWEFLRMYKECGGFYCCDERKMSAAYPGFSQRNLQIPRIWVRILDKEN